ncbi:hypothetical protein BgiBS90_034808 [Biomphalaria glabrata]|nr:hypothetical protein BgiBS90_034808 [Biomphalaria glabrata]
MIATTSIREKWLASAIGVIQKAKQPLLHRPRRNFANWREKKATTVKNTADVFVVCHSHRTTSVLTDKPPLLQIVFGTNSRKVGAKV